MKAFTVVTKWFKSMAQEAGRRIQEYGGIESVEYVSCKDSAACHKAKLERLLDYNEPVWFFDSDWFQIQKCPLPLPVGNVAFGAPNDSGVDGYKGSCVPPRSAICSCLFGLDMGHSACRNAIQTAIKLQARDYGRDEVYLNMGVFSDPQLVVARMSNYWNWCGNPIPLTVAIHAAGRQDKEEWLRSQVK